MYFSIPDTIEVSAKTNNQQPYTLFNIHVNGIHHCSLRYSQLRKFHEELQQLLPTAMANIESFPPKKLFSLTAKEIDERRLLLEFYLQTIVQNKYIITSSYFNEFFFNAQIDTFSNETLDINAKINLTICLLNNHELIIENILISDDKSNLFDACAQKVQLQEDFISYFSLYFYEQKNNQLNMIRPIYDFESPYLSLKQLKKVYEQACIVLKKSYWNSEFDLQLIEDRRARNLLFIQAQYEVEQARNLYSSDVYQQLDILRENNSFKDYLLLARTLKLYGHIIISNCSIDYPINDTKTQKLCQCLLAIGNKEINFYINTDQDKKKNELLLKVTRIRCWKISWAKHDMNISLEYLIKKDSLQWITIYSEQAVLISTLLQSTVDEILANKANATNLTKETDTLPTTTDEKSQLKASSNGLATRTESDLQRLNNNDIFDRGDDDDL